MRSEARVDAFSIVIEEGTTVDGFCTVDGVTVSPGIFLSVTSTPTFEVTASSDSSATYNI